MTKNSFTTIFTVLLAFLYAGTLSAGNPVFGMNDFSADMVSITKAGTFTSKIFVTKEKMRMESPQSITITRMDKKVVWILMPAQKMYMEQTLKPEHVVAGSSKMPGEISRQAIGKETVNGKKTTKYKIVYKDRDTQETIYQWIASDSKFPIKTASVDGSWIHEYKNLKQGKQPASLFEIPAGYKKFSYQVPSFN